MMRHIPRYGFRGLRGANPICLDQSQNAVDCSDPNCTYGDCGATSQYVPTGGCLDQGQNQVMCNDPNCTYGDCLPASTAGGHGGTVQAAVSSFPQAVAPLIAPSPRVSVPLSASIPGSFGLWFSNSTLVPGFPNWAVMASALVGVVLLTSPRGGRRR